MIDRWHAYLAMSRHDQAWHENDMADELAEYHEETHWFKKWSELSDVVYTTTRSRWDDCPLAFPLQPYQYYLGIVYMIPKYTLRWYFYRTAGRKAGAARELHEVRNPHKTHKLHHIAAKYDVDPRLFQTICERQLRYWPLLP